MTYYTLTIFDAELNDNIIQQIDQRIPKYSYQNPNGNIDSPLYGTLCTLIHPASTNVFTSMATAISGNTTQWTPIVGVGPSGAVYSLNPGSNMTITQVGSTITFNSTGGGLSAIGSYYPTDGSNATLQISGNTLNVPQGFTFDPAKRMCTATLNGVANAGDLLAIGHSANAAVGNGFATPVLIGKHMMLGLNTAATTGSAAHKDCVSTTLAPTQRQLQPFITFVVGTPTITNVRYWFALTDTELSGVSSPTTQNVAGLRYDTGAGDSNWKLVTCDGGGTPTITDMGVAPTTSAATIIQLDLTNSSQVTGWVNGTSKTNTTHLPSNTANLAYDAALTTLANTSVTLRISEIMLETY